MINLRNKFNHGVATLSMVFVLVGIILLVSVGLALLSVNQTADSVDTEAGLRARANADMAIKEALLRLARDYKYGLDEYDAPVSLNLTETGAGASFRVINESLTSSRILAQGQFGEATRNLQAVVEFDANTGINQSVILSGQREIVGDLCALADFNNNGQVNESDTELVSPFLGCNVNRVWLPGEFVSEAPWLQCYHLDLNLDGEFNQADLDIVATCYGWPNL